MDEWKTLKIDPVATFGKFLTVESHQLQAPNGATIDNWAWLRCPDYVIVVPARPDGTFICMEQGRYAVREPSIGFPGGYLEPGEDPLEGAKREMEEELGLISDEWESLGTYVVDANRHLANASFFLARNVKQGRALPSDDLENTIVRELTPAELQEAINSNSIKVLGWIAAATLAMGKFRAKSAPL